MQNIVLWSTTTVHSIIFIFIFLKHLALLLIDACQQQMNAFSNSRHPLKLTYYCICIKGKKINSYMFLKYKYCNNIMMVNIVCLIRVKKAFVHFPGLFCLINSSFYFFSVTKALTFVCFPWSYVNYQCHTYSMCAKKITDCKRYFII